VDPRLLATVLAGFGGVALVLHPTIAKDQLAPGLVGLASGMLSALAYLQIATLGRAGEPELRVVFYFSLGSCLAGIVLATFEGWHALTASGLGMLIAAGVLATTAQVLLTRAYAVGRTLTNASLNYLGIAFSFAYGVWLFDDPVTLAQLSGIGLIVGAGLAATRLRARALGSDAPDTLPPPSDP
jgi:S-adenosylmethionine uptake transporter